MQKVVSVILCGGFRFPTREKELEVIKSALRYGSVNLEDRFDFSKSSFEFIHDDENNSILANYEGDGGSAGYWNTMDYCIRSHLRECGGIIFLTESQRYFSFYMGRVEEF